MSSISTLGFAGELDVEDDRANEDTAVTKELACAAFIIIGLFEILTAERCRRQPTYCQDRFMSKNGWSRSLFGYWFYFGRPDVARQAIMHDFKLQRWLIAEIYIRGTALIVLGLLVQLLLD